MATEATDIIERRFCAASDCTPLAVEAALRAALRAAWPTLPPLAPVERRDAYLDTRDRWLYRAGLALRVTTREDRVTLGLEPLTHSDAEPGAIRETSEVLTGPPGPFPGPIPGAQIASWLRPLMGERALEEILVLSGHEWSGRVRTAAGVEFDLSVARLIPAGRGDDAGVLVAELLLPAGAEVDAPLAPFAAALGVDLIERPPLPVALGAASVAVPALQEGDDLVLQPEDRFADAAYRVLRRHFGRMMWNEPGTRLGLDPESLHDMRVAARRMRAALRAFREALPERRRQALRRDLKWVGTALGAVRDMDVHWLQLRREAHRLGKDVQEGVCSYMDHLALRRRKARTALLRMLETRRYAGFVDRCRRFLEAGPPARTSAPAAGRPAAAEACRVVRTAMDEVLKAGRAINAGSGDAELHRLRIRCKRLRYTCEFFADYFGRPALNFAARVTRLQDILGEHQDAVVARQELDAFAGHAGGSRERLRQLCLAAGQLMQFYADWARRARAEFRRTWAKFDRRKARKPTLDRMKRFSQPSR